MKTRTRLFNRDFPKGQLFYDTDEVDRALKEGWVDAEHKVEDIIAKPVPEKPTKSVSQSTSQLVSQSVSQSVGNLCACGCGKETRIGKKYSSQDCYFRAMKRGKYR